jgi:hypothetical protein
MHPDIEIPSTRFKLSRNAALLLGYFLYAMLSGALRKWVFMGSSGINSVIQGLQLFMPFIIIFMMRRQKSLFESKPLIIYSIVLVLMAANPLNQSIFHGIFGIFLHLGFWVLMLPYLNERDAFPFEDLVKPFIIISFCQIGLGFMQFNLPLDHFLNRYESGDDVSGFEGGMMVRVIGTFSYIGGFGGFIFFAGLLVWSLMVENKRAVYLVYGLAFGGLLSGFMNGSRSAVLPYLFFVLAGSLSFGTTSTKIKIIGVFVIALFIGSVYNIGQNFPVMERALDAFTGRVSSGSETGENSSRTLATLYEVTGFRGEYPLFGVGLGATYQGAIAGWGKSEEVKDYGFYEEEPERILLEGGYVLLLLRGALFIYFMMKSKIPKLFSVPILFYTFFFPQMTFSTFQSTFTFFGFALLDKIYYLKSLADEEALETSEEETPQYQETFD